jgi:hypothetical protein
MLEAGGRHEGSGVFIGDPDPQGTSISSTASAAFASSLPHPPGVVESTRMLTARVNPCFSIESPIFLPDRDVCKEGTPDRCQETGDRRKCLHCSESSARFQNKSRVPCVESKSTATLHCQIQTFPFAHPLEIRRWMHSRWAICRTCLTSPTPLPLPLVLDTSSRRGSRKK